jgi:hypothetical protein
MFGHLERSLPLTPEANPERVLAAAQHAVEAIGYEWKPLSQNAAHVQQGTGRIRFLRVSQRTAFTITVSNSTVTFTQGTTGLGLAGTPVGGAAIARTRRKFRQTVRHIEQALRAAQLA